MRKIWLAFLLFTFTSFVISEESFAQSKKKSYKPKTVRVRGYTTKKGKYVRPHYRSKPTRRRASVVLYPGTMAFRREDGNNHTILKAV